MMKFERLNNIFEQLNNIFERLEDILTYIQNAPNTDGLFEVSIDLEDGYFIIKLEKLVDDMTEVLKALTKLYDDGYLNKTNTNLPMLLLAKPLFDRFDIYNTKQEAYFTINLNTLGFNMILLLLLEAIIKIESRFNSNDTIVDCHVDLKTDISTVRKNILRMINPIFRHQINNRGLTVLLTSVIGYDSEYELNSSLKTTNDLFSVQLAGSSPFGV